MRADYKVVLDASVLLPMPLADTLLRLAEHPRLYLPKWSNHIMDEVTRNLIKIWNVPPDRAKRRQEELYKHFPEAWVDGYEEFIPLMRNHDKDRHVLAAAVRAGAEVIVTYNAKDFAYAELQRWNVERQGPSMFLRNLYDLEPALVVHKLHKQAEFIGRTFDELLSKLNRNVPGFVAYICEQQNN